MDALDQLVKTFFDWEAMAAVLPNMITVGLPNTLILAVSSGVLGCILGMVLAVMGTSRVTAAALALPDLHGRLPRRPGDCDHPPHRPRARPRGPGN